MSRASRASVMWDFLSTITISDIYEGFTVLQYEVLINIIIISHSDTSRVRNRTLFGQYLMKLTQDCDAKFNYPSLELL